jgi:hypothetical protein
MRWHFLPGGNLFLTLGLPSAHPRFDPVCLLFFFSFSLFALFSIGVAHNAVCRLLFRRLPSPSIFPNEAATYSNFPTYRPPGRPTRPLTSPQLAAANQPNCRGTSAGFASRKRSLASSPAQPLRLPCLVTTKALSANTNLSPPFPTHRLLSLHRFGTVQ